MCTQISGYVVPRGTEVMLSTWALHYNRRVWGGDAALWRPERWLDGGSTVAARKDTAGNVRFMPFLIGPSNCIGQHLALVRCAAFSTFPATPRLRVNTAP